jgi:menaquinone-dependent protoporphyrinogen oxidase
MRVLVAYASKYGSTKGIAEFIGQKLGEVRVSVQVSAVDNVGIAGGYDAYVIGSALYMGHWMKEAKQFLSKNRDAMAGHPVWLFSSGPVGIKATDAKGRDLLEVSGPTELEELKVLVNPRDHRVFFGAFDGANLKGAYALFYKMAQRSQSARESMAEGDFRDWKLIEAWVGSIASALAPEKPAGR